MRILFTGGGTAGHILPNIAVIEELRERFADRGVDILYVGSHRGPERELCEKYVVDFQAISTGKLRRYFAWENFIDPFRVIKGCFDALGIVWKWKPNVVMSKGGFVSVPVVFAAWVLRVPVVLHEADVSMGLSNRVCARFAKVVCVSWEKTVQELEKKWCCGDDAKKMVSKKVLFTGMPVRRELMSGVREKGLRFLGFDGKKPILLVMGGSLGAKNVNRLVRNVVPDLLKIYDVVHLTGEIDSTGVTDGKSSIMGYRAFPYLYRELFDVYACTSVVVSRAGASSIAELSSLGLPCIFIPLSATQSRGDQIVNANVLYEAGACEVFIPEKDSLAKFVKMVCGLGTDSHSRTGLSNRIREFGERHRRAAGQLAEVICGIAEK